MAKRAFRDDSTAIPTGEGYCAEPAETLQISGGLNSPARRLQNFLDGEVRRDETAGERWSTRRTVLFVTATCGAFWTVVFVATGILIG